MKMNIFFLTTPRNQVEIRLHSSDTSAKCISPHGVVSGKIIFFTAPAFQIPEDYLRQE
jgi:hypothetical protein